VRRHRLQQRLNFFETEMGREGGTAFPKGRKPTEEMEEEDGKPVSSCSNLIRDLNLLTLIYQNR